MTDQDIFEAAMADARANPPLPSGTLIARIHCDAVRQQQARPWWRVFVQAIGGRAGVSGLITATCVGLWIGLAPPAGLAPGMDMLWESEAELAFSYGVELMEESDS